MEKALQFCRGCFTNASWQAGGLCPTCMLREEMEQSRQPQTTYTYNPAVETPGNLIGQFIGMIIAWGGVMGFFIWVFADDTYWNCVKTALMLPLYAVYYVTLFILGIFT